MCCEALGLRRLRVRILWTSRMLAVVSNAISVSREESRRLGKAPNFPQGDLGTTWVAISAVCAFGQLDSLSSG